MTLSTQLAYFVPSKVRKRGKSYAEHGLVTMTACGADRVEATVTGSEEYDVLLTRERQQVYASCSCLVFHDRGEICKHI